MSTLSATLALVAPAAVLAGEESTTVTDLGPRILLTLGIVGLIGLCLYGMRRGWRNRAARQSEIPEPPPAPVDLAPAHAVSGKYVATTSADDLLDRVVVHGLGNRGRADLYLRTEGLLIDRVGEHSLWIPRESLLDVRLGRAQAQKAFEAGGVILVRWALGGYEFETGFRADDPDEHVATAAALAGLITTTGGTA